ncbi:MAG TPA: hypothetical protein ENG70_01335 [Candidatus Cloacimonetes bacterium]|nr:hypothetical protein [Candidatus Cloacimonadota bacterium]HEX37492.1 hypothetical protein [Candidatus Cloacimonadota bacterium]
MKKIILFFLLMCFSSLLFGQMSMFFEVFDFDVVYPSAFDKNNPADQPIIFILDIENLSGEEQQCKLAMSLHSTEYGELLSAADGLITKYDGIPGNTESQYLLFSDTQPAYNLTNRDIINNNVKIAGSWNDILSNIPDFETFVMDNGYLPSGTYTFAFTLYDLQMVPIMTVSENLIISNDLVVNLLAPGSEVAQGQSTSFVLTVSDETPTFAWQSSASGHTLTLWELDPTVYSSIQFDDLPDPLVELTGISELYYQYPSSLPNLKDKYVYVWNVEGEFTTTLGSESVNSEYYGFKYTEPSGTSGGDPNVENLVDNLTALGLFDPGQLGGYDPTGQVYINGVLITVENLGEFLNGLFNGEYEIESIVIE